MNIKEVRTVSRGSQKNLFDDNLMNSKADAYFMMQRRSKRSI